MKTNVRVPALLVALLLLPGCLSGIVDEIDDIVIWERSPEGDWPQLSLGERTRTTPTLETYDDCAVLLEDLKDALWEQTLVEIDQNAYWNWASPNMWLMGGGMVDDVAMEMDGGMPEASADANSGGTAPSSSGGEDRSGTYSETNNQESGVDEADFLKFDGHHFYMINNNHLVIIGVPEHGNVTLVSDMELEGQPLQMMKEGDSLVIISAINSWNIPSNDPLRSIMQTSDGNWRSSNLVKYTVIDITNRSDPNVGREIFIEGSHETARMVNGTVRSVSHMWSYIPGIQTYPSLSNDYWDTEDWEDRMSLWNSSVEDLVDENLAVLNTLTLADFAPQMHQRNADGTISSYSSGSGDCSEFSGSADGVGRGFTSIMTVDLLSEEFSSEVDHIASSWVEVYASGDMMVLAEPANDWWWFWRNNDYEDAT
ncbi:MAG: beta-propeller domain-containing protein, partial [Candidatus Thalassarchaeaceae archaeon]|nr:beta-propeller domain-containing protein [Candidatus Thalassarchaeaceae archaeon]